MTQWPDVGLLFAEPDVLEDAERLVPDLAATDGQRDAIDAGADAAAATAAAAATTAATATTGIAR